MLKVIILSLIILLFSCSENNSQITSTYFEKEYAKEIDFLNQNIADIYSQCKANGKVSKEINDQLLNSKILEISIWEYLKDDKNGYSLKSSEETIGSSTSNLINPSKVGETTITKWSHNKGDIYEYQKMVTVIDTKKIGYAIKIK
ncbi:hypothetical protein LNTAR_12952 [Lentisphaera araneosa HTCC2155]|jgi:hypothetical protein|uniref:Lipoprotein n=1 Tax=Lentisphaera araneosa HTCC2155 TaxID=313628 RepID=A6DUH4_9BACT|nr:hypothetical protein [Lentisphaera araneosa]EDM24709.1 hypothetical protein LNTAR_12952 [Lentisphaera araneosa HTCC2155]